MFSIISFKPKIYNTSLAIYIKVKIKRKQEVYLVDNKTILKIYLTETLLGIVFQM